MPSATCIVDKGGEVATRPKALDLDGPSLQPPRPSLTRLSTHTPPRCPARANEEALSNSFFFGWEPAEPEVREAGVGAVGKWRDDPATTAVTTENLA
jgi:hypothetical protein